MGRAMNPSAESVGLPQLYMSRGRMFAAAAAAVVGGLVTVPLPWDLRALISFDLAAMTYIVLFVRLMSVATPQQSADLSRRVEPSGSRVLISTVLLSVVAIAAIIAMVGNMNGKDLVIKIAEIVASVSALFLSWMLAHIFFGLEYMRMYYDRWDASTKSVIEPDLDFPTRPLPDFWDFMYYSFTIAMCYQTSDVTINVAATRRLTLLHAIYSFFFVVLMISIVVNALDNVI